MRNQQIVVFEYRSKGCPGYLAKLELDGNKIVKRDFVPESRRGDSDDRCFRGKHSPKYFDVDKLENGIYEAKGWNQSVMAGKREITEYYEITGGEIIWCAEKLEELPIFQPEEAVTLPDLEGSPKQISWAEDIRSKLVAYCTAKQKPIPEWMLQQQSAKFFIDNRAKFGV